jgi:hypothetical protein
LSNSLQDNTYTFSFELDKKEIPRTFEYNKCIINCNYTVKINNTSYTVKSYDEYKEKISRVELNDFMDMIDRDVQSFKMNLTTRETIILESEVDIDFKEFISPYLEPKFAKFGDERYNVVIPYRYKFSSYNSYYNEVRTTLTYDNEEIQSYEEDLEYSVESCNPYFKERFYNIQDYKTAQLNLSDSLNNKGIVFKTSYFTYYDAVREEILLSSEHIEDKKFVLVEIELNTFINNMNEIRDEFYSLYNETSNLIEDFYERGMSALDFRSRIDVARNNLFIDTESINIVAKVKDQVVSLLNANKITHTNTTNSIGSMIDLSGLLTSAPRNKSRNKRRN